MKYLEILHEVDLGGDMDDGYIDRLKDKNDFTNPQLDLFPKEIPTLDPKVPQGMKIVGKIGAYRVVMSEKSDAAFQKNIQEVDYVLFDKSKAIAWIALYIPPKPESEIFGMNGEGGQVVSVYINPEYRGQRLGLKMYVWVLTNVCEYLVADEQQTQDGAKLWRRALNSRAFDVEVYDKRNSTTRRRWSGKDFDQVYQNSELVPWMTLRGKADLIRD